MPRPVRSFVTAAVLVLASGAAQAVPMFTNPTFASTSSTTSFTYSQPITGWTDASGNGSATGIAAQNPSYLWDNGIAPNNETNVTFLQNKTAALQQMVAGFVVGHIYQIVVVADARAITGPALLSIGVSGMEIGAQVLSPSPVAAVDPYGVYATPWATYTSAAFTAAGTSVLVQFQNAGIVGSTTFDDVTIDLGSARIVDVTPTVVPEPTSMILAASGLVLVLLGRSVRSFHRTGTPRRQPSAG